MPAETSTIDGALCSLGTVVFRSSWTVHVELTGELDAATAVDLRHLLDSAANDRPYEVVVDLAALTFIDSAGAGALLLGGKKLQGCGCTLVLRSASDQARRMFEMLDMKRYALVED